MTIIEAISVIIGIMSIGYFIGRMIEAWLIGSWNYPKKEGGRMRFSEVVDTPEHAREFIELNQISQQEIVGIIVVWKEGE